MKKIRPVIKTFSLMGAVLFCAFSSANIKAQKDCYTQFVDTEKSIIKLPEDLMERYNLWENIKSNPNKYADLLNLPKNSEIRKTFFNIFNESLIIPSVQEVHPNLTQYKNNGKTEVTMEVDITFKRPNLKFKSVE